MKKNIKILLIAFLPFVSFSQSLFDKFEDLDGVTAVVVNKSMFNLLSKIDVNVDNPDTKDFISIAKTIKSLKFFTTEDKEISAEMKTSVTKYLDTASLEELMRVEDKDMKIEFYIKKGRDDNHVSELLMFMTGIKNIEYNEKKIETVLLSLIGDIDLNKINSLTKKMNLPKELNKAKKR